MLFNSDVRNNPLIAFSLDSTTYNMGVYEKILLWGAIWCAVVVATIVLSSSKIPFV